MLHLRAMREMQYVLSVAVKLTRKITKSTGYPTLIEFTDAANLQNAWHKIEIPPPILSFFAEFFNFKASDYQKLQKSNTLNEDEGDNNLSGSISNSKCLKVTELFQIMHYILTNGSQRTPLHIMNGLATHDTCRNSTLIKSLNHIGVSISYS